MGDSRRVVSSDTSQWNALGRAMGVLWLLTGSLSAQAVTDVFPSQVIVLADWGMSDVSEVGYLHFGVIHRRQGDTLAVYDVRHRTPVVQRPGEPHRSTPPLDRDVFLLGHFDRGNTNRLGGYFNGFARAPSMSAVSIARAPDDGPALAYSYDKAAGSFAGFWIHPLRLQATSQGTRFPRRQSVCLPHVRNSRRARGGGPGAAHCRSRMGAARRIAADRGTSRRSSSVDVWRLRGSARGFPVMSGLSD